MHTLEFTVIEKSALKFKYRCALIMRIIGLLMLLPSLAACETTQGSSTEITMSDRPILAKVEIPNQALLLFESMSIRDPDRTGNWRFYFRQDGCFFNARNTQLFITEISQFQRDDPSLFWNKPFADTPDRCLNDQQRNELLETIRNANFKSLNAYYQSSGNKQSSSSVERWTVVIDKEIKTVVAEKGSVPKQLVELREMIDRLVAQATRQ